MHETSNENLIKAIRSLVKDERRITRQILDHINEVERRRLYSDLGFSSIFEWLVKDIGYSESAAYRRLQAARLLRVVPDVAYKIESGELGLTVLSKVQTAIRADEKRTGEKISTEQKSEILADLELCSGREAEFRLAARFPETQAATVRETVRVAGEDQISVTVTFTREQFKKLERIRELLSHTHLGSSQAELLEEAMDVFLEKRDPLMRIVKPQTTRGNTAAEAEAPWKKADDAPVSSSRTSSKAVKPSVRNAVFRNAAGQCEYRDRISGRRCESRHLLEVDHIQPRALGGTNAQKNLRALCRAHNILAAEQILGRGKMQAFWIRL